MNQSLNTSRSCHIRAVKPAIQMMASLGFSEEDCLQGTEITSEMLADISLKIPIEQEYAFFRNLLNISQDPAIGLKIGAGYRVDAYGILGYAMLCSQNVEEAFDLGFDYWALINSHFSIQRIEEAKLVGASFSVTDPIPKDLVRLYWDRELEGAVSLLNSYGIERSNIAEIRCDFIDKKQTEIYQNHFGCTVKPSQGHAAILIDKSILQQQLPLRDDQTAKICKSQCQIILNKMKSRGKIRDQVVNHLLSEPGRFPSQEEIAQAMNVSVRTLRRNLVKEETSYQELLKEVRLQLAKDYLMTDLSIEFIAEKIGYSEVSNFSRAFKQWTSMSPKLYREKYNPTQNN